MRHDLPNHFESATETVPASPGVHSHSITRRCRAALLALWIGLVLGAAAAEPPQVGTVAPNFKLQTLEGRSVELAPLAKTGPVVVVVLRGWPGYQCPLCDRQVREYVEHAPAFEAIGARVVFVYPGPMEGLKEHAREFLASAGKKWPSSFAFALDPDHAMVNSYQLRWEAPNETAYPSTFVVDKAGIIRHAKVSRGHGDRSKAEDTAREAAKLR